MKKNAKRHVNNMQSEARHNEDLEWLVGEGDELIRLHRKLNEDKPRTRADKMFLADVVYFALGESLRVDDEAEIGNN